PPPRGPPPDGAPADPRPRQGRPTRLTRRPWAPIRGGAAAETRTVHHRKAREEAGPRIRVRRRPVTGRCPGSLIRCEAGAPFPGGRCRARGGAGGRRAGTPARTARPPRRRRLDRPRDGENAENNGEWHPVGGLSAVGGIPGRGRVLQGEPPPGGAVPGHRPGASAET